MPSLTLSPFAGSLTPETAFTVLAAARRLRARGKDIIELQIGDSSLPTPRHAVAAAQEALADGMTHYGPSSGLPSFREAIALHHQREFGVDVGPQNVLVGPGAKIFEQFFCETFLAPGDAVLVFTPHFPTYPPNIERCRARIVYSRLRPENHFRLDLNQVEHFVRQTPRARAIFLNTPHNPTGGVATAQDLRDLAELVRGRDIALFSDEPYCHMVWQGRHETPLAQPGMLGQTVAAYTFSKSYLMSGWRLGYALGSAPVIETMTKLMNISVSCVPPFVQLGGQAALEQDADERDEAMAQFRHKVALMVEELRRLPDVAVAMPSGAFYVFPDVSAVCRRLGIQSHGLAMYLLEGADDRLGVGCLGGECFGPAGQGFLRVSCTESDERLRQAVAFLAEAVTRTDRVAKYLDANPGYRWTC
jgi:aspartate aminotransferase